MNDACFRQIIAWLNASQFPTLKDLRPGLQSMFIQVKSPRAFHRDLMAHDPDGTLLAKAKKIRRNYMNRQSLLFRQKKHLSESSLQVTSIEKLSTTTVVLAHALSFEASAESVRRAPVCTQRSVLPMECTPVGAISDWLPTSPDWRAHSQRVFL